MRTLPILLSLFLVFTSGTQCSPTTQSTSWVFKGQTRTLPRAVEYGDYCLADNPSTACDPGGAPVCTSNDVRLAQAVYVSGPKSCIIGTSVTLTFNVEWVSTAQTRYDLSAYIAMDGGTAMTGQCYGTILYGTGWPTTDGRPTISGSSIGSASSTSNHGPYLEQSSPNDQCRDIAQGQVTWQTLSDVPFICRDGNGDGTADISACLGWQQNANEASCNGIDLALVTSGAKCNCQPNINIQGVTVCSSQQTLCYGLGANGALLNDQPCEPTWSARFKVTSSTAATNFPPSSILYGNVYLDFQTSNQRMALQYFDTTAVADDAALTNSLTPAIVREDVIWPCKSVQKTKCGAGCTALFSNNWIPRLFREGPYTVNTANSKLTPDVAATSTECPTSWWSQPNYSCFKKTVPTNAPTTAIAFVWSTADTTQTSRTVLGAARQRDGTMWEFFKTGSTVASCTASSTPYGRGQTLAKELTPSPARTFQAPYDLSNVGSTAAATCTTALYDFTKYDSTAGCTSNAPLCESAAQVAFVVDEQASVVASDWRTYWVPYVWNAIQGFDQSATTPAQFGVCFAAGLTTGSGPYCSPPGALTSDRQSLCNSILKVGTYPSCGGPSILPFTSTATSTDFAALIKKALDAYWASATTTPRRLVVLVGGPNMPNAVITWASLNTLYQTRGVQVHAVGIGAGASDTALLANIVGSSGGTVTQWAQPAFLPSDNFLYRKLCPASTSVCSCGGFCSCVGTCSCPASCVTTDKCNPATCDNNTPAAGCVVNPANAVNCNPSGNPCVLSSCDPTTGSCSAPTTRDCSVNDKCLIGYCDSNNIAQPCQTKTKLSQGIVVCDDQNGCTTDVCSNGACTFTPLAISVCDDGNVCTDDACVNTGSVSHTCSHTLITCNDGNACTDDSCDSKTGCKYAAKNCNDGNACTVDSCDTKTGCLHTPLACDDSNPCTQNLCNTASGCDFSQATVCNDGNKCTADACDSTKGCTYTAIKCTPPSACFTSSCDTSTGSCANSPIDPCAVCATADCSALVPNACQQRGCLECETGDTGCSNAKTTCSTIQFSGPSSLAACQAALTSPGISFYCYLRDNSATVCPSDKCGSYTCSGSTSATCTPNFSCNDGSACTTDACNPAVGCVYTPTPAANACVSDQCTTRACNSGTGTCQVVGTTTCNDGSACTTDSCDTSTGCKYTTIPCNPSGPCMLASCDSATGVCSQTKDTSTAQCRGCDSSAIAACTTAGTPCAPKYCISDCNDPRITSATLTACNAAVGGPAGTYCLAVPVQCPADTDCTHYECDAITGECAASLSALAQSCTPTTGCNAKRCVEGSKTCVLSGDPCAEATSGSLCQSTVCQDVAVSPTNPQGFQCAPGGAIRDCTDYSCKASALPPSIPEYYEVVYGSAAKTQFETTYAARSGTCTPIACTADLCDSAKGCVNTPLACAVQAGTCNETLGCYEAGNTFGFTAGACQLQVDQSLIDFCGKCFGDNAECFFSSVVPVSTVAGIAAGAVAGIVIACVIAALLIFFLTKKGYDYWQARSNMASTGLHDNPTFVHDKVGQGSMPD